MASNSLWIIFVAALGGGIGSWAREAYYERYKPKRRALPAHIRNAGFWTDTRLRIAEIVVWSALIVPPVYGVLLAVLWGRFGIQLPLP